MSVLVNSTNMVSVTPNNQLYTLFYFMSPTFDIEGLQITYKYTIEGKYVDLDDNPNDQVCFNYESVTKFDYVSGYLSVFKQMLEKLYYSKKKGIFYASFAARPELETKINKNCR